MKSITLTALGGAREIGANSYLIRANGHEVLLDCGIHPKKEGRGALPVLSLLRRPPDAVVVTHGHVDHCGALPELLKEFPGTVPYATSATVGIMDRMLHNSVSVMGILAQEQDIAEYPLYTHEDVDYVIQSANRMELDSPFSLDEAGSVTLSFHHAGHVLGSASILLQLENHTLFYTGDICTADQELMAARTRLDGRVDVDTLIIETTYGANQWADRISIEEETARFAEAITKVLDRGGAVLVPAFALGRTQEMLNIIARLQEQGAIPEVPVYASGLGRAIYEVYVRYPHYLNPAATLRPLARFGRVGDVYNRKVRRDLIREPCILVATSGMMIEETPSSVLAEEMVHDPRHGIFFVGYLDPDTLGYKLLHAGQGDWLSFGRHRPAVKIALEDIAGFHFGSHAPRGALRAVIKRLNPTNVVFVHGDPEAIDWMHDRTGPAFCRFAPGIGEEITLEA